jgi:hypothetical protein
MALHNALGTAFDPPASSEKEVLDPLKLGPLINRLRKLLAEDDMRSAEIAQQGSGQLEALLGTEYAPLMQMLADFDFPAALALLEKASARHPKLADHAV